MNIECISRNINNLKYDNLVYKIIHIVKKYSKLTIIRGTL